MGTGFVPADFEGDEFELWPENDQAMRLFETVQTQWRMGFGGAVGLDYNVLFNRLDRLRLPDRESDWLFDDLRVLEDEALLIFRKKD